MVATENTAIETAEAIPQESAQQTTGLTGAEGSPFKKKKKLSRKAWLFLLIGLILLTWAGFGIYRLFFQKEELTVLTGMTTYGSLNEAIEGSGTTVPADSMTYTLNGKVLEWKVKAGDTVQAGDLLYVLDASEAEDQLLEYEVELEELEEELSALTESINSRAVTAPFAGRIERIQAEVGRHVQNGATLATLVDNSTMKATLYFSYAYRDDIRKGMNAVVSVPDQMLNLTGTVVDIHYVDYVTASGMQCFSVTLQIPNPGSLTEGTTVTCWLEIAEGGYAYAVDDTTLTYNRAETITSGAAGEVTAIYVVDYQRAAAGDTLFVIDTSNYEVQLETLQKQIQNHEKKIEELQKSIATEYTRYADISGQVVSANYSTNRMSGLDSGSVTIYNQDTMQISINVDELDADYLDVGMDVYVYRTTSSKTVSYPATLSYLSLEATSGSSGVSTFAATITIDSDGALSSGVTVYYSISPSEGSTEETILAPIAALRSYDGGHYLLVQAESVPENALSTAETGIDEADYPDGYYAMPVEVGDYNGTYIQILSGVDRDATVFLRYRNAAPSGGDKTSDAADSDEMSGMPGFGNMGSMPGFGNMGSMPGFGNMGGNMGGTRPDFGGSMGGNMGGNRGNR